MSIIMRTGRTGPSPAFVEPTSPSPTTSREIMRDDERNGAACNGQHGSCTVRTSYAANVTAVANIDFAIVGMMPL